MLPGMHLDHSDVSHFMYLPLCLCLSASMSLCLSLPLCLALFCQSIRSYLVLLFVLTSLTFNDSKPSAGELRLISSSSLNVACLCTMGSQNTELEKCFSCHCMEFDWRVYYQDVYTCSKCKDLDCFESQRNSCLNLSLT